MRPTGRALGLLGTGLPVAALPTLLLQSDLWFLWLGFLGAFALLMVVELALVPGPLALQVSVSAPSVLYFGDRQQVEIEAVTSRAMTVQLRLSTEGVIEPLPTAVLEVSPAGSTRLQLPLQPIRRGLAQLPMLHTRWTGPLGLLWRELDTKLQVAIRVVPNVRAVRQKALQMVARREFQTGLRVERYIGDGTEFEALREFVVGMDRRSIDWKATARHRRLLCREFRAERDHQVMLCIDTGRLMAEPLNGMPRLDHAMHAALQLGYVCLRTGDRVGLFAFAGGAQQQMLPQAGVHALHAMQDRMAELDYTTVETNYTRSMTQLLQQLRRRTLVVLFTEFQDSITAELMLPNVQWLARRHLLLFVSMQDPLLAKLARKEPYDVEDIHRAVVAEEIHRERLLVLERIRQAGAQVLDVDVEQLGPGLIDRYLQVKRREML
ncbi:MAG: DUF58 domain-containing protein [Planctomycetota bacterium]